MIKWVAVPYVLGISAVFSKPSDIAKVLLPLPPATIEDIASIIGSICPGSLSIDSSLIPIERYVKESNEIVSQHIKLTMSMLVADKINNKAIVVDMEMRNIMILPLGDKVVPVVFVVSILVFCNSENISIGQIELSINKRDLIAKSLIKGLELSLNADIYVSSMVHHRMSIPNLYREATKNINVRMANMGVRNFIFREFPLHDNRGPLLVPVIVN